MMKKCKLLGLQLKASEYFTSPSLLLFLLFLTLHLESTTLNSEARMCPARRQQLDTMSEKGDKKKGDIHHLESLLCSKHQRAVNCIVPTWNFLFGSMEPAELFSFLLLCPELFFMSAAYSFILQFLSLLLC